MRALVIGDEPVVDVACDEALQAADDVLLGESLGGAPPDVVDGRLVPAHQHDHDSVERRVGLSLPASNEPVPVRDTRRRGDRASAAELRERCFGADALRFVAGNDHLLGGRVRNSHAQASPSVPVRAAPETLVGLLRPVVRRGRPIPSGCGKCDLIQRLTGSRVPFLIDTSARSGGETRGSSTAA